MWTCLLSRTFSVLGGTLIGSGIGSVWKPIGETRYAFMEISSVFQRFQLQLQSGLDVTLDFNRIYWNIDGPNYWYQRHRSVKMGMVESKYLPML